MILQNTSTSIARPKTSILRVFLLVTGRLLLSMAIASYCTAVIVFFPYGFALGFLVMLIAPFFVPIGFGAGVIICLILHQSGRTRFIYFALWGFAIATLNGVLDNAIPATSGPYTVEDPVRFPEYFYSLTGLFTSYFMWRLFYANIPAKS